MLTLDKILAGGSSGRRGGWMSWVRIAVVCALAASCGSAASASEDRGPFDVAAAVQLADWAREFRSPEALVAAAQMMATLPVTQGEIRKVTASADDREVADPSARPPLEPEVILEEARTLAEALGRRHLSKHLKTLVLPSSRGAEGGAKATFETVKGQGTDAYLVQFEGRSPAEISVVGQGVSDLDLVILDSLGKRVAADAGHRDTAFVSWLPPTAGQYRVEIRNLGSEDNSYLLLTN